MIDFGLFSTGTIQQKEIEIENLSPIKAQYLIKESRYENINFDNFQTNGYIDEFEGVLDAKVQVGSRFMFFGNWFDFDVDIIDTTIEQFHTLISSFFKQKMDEFNFNINKFEFFDEKKPFFDKNKTFHMHFKEKYREPKFYFLIRDCAMHFNSKNIIDETFFEEMQDIDEEQEINNKINIESNIKEEKENNKEIELRKNVESGKSFKIIIQTYNHLIKELVVYPEMTIDMLKNLIEKNFMVSKEHQELLYLVYKLDENEKMLKDYYIRPNGIVFLRGYYFPLVFVDYFNKKNKNVISINIAEQIKYIRKKIITMLNLEDNYDYKLLLNGRTLDDEDYLINSNVQKMQMIYFK